MRISTLSADPSLHFLPRGGLARGPSIFSETLFEQPHMIFTDRKRIAVVDLKLQAQTSEQLFLFCRRKPVHRRFNLRHRRHVDRLSAAAKNSKPMGLLRRLTRVALPMPNSSAPALLPTILSPFTPLSRSGDEIFRDRTTRSRRPRSSYGRGGGRRGPRSDRSKLCSCGAISDHGMGGSIRRNSRALLTSAFPNTLAYNGDRGARAGPAPRSP